jgi:exoribonuclease-2
MTNSNDKQHRALLQRIARRAMVERGLLPDFSPQALAELDGLRGRAAQAEKTSRDLRHLLWCSIEVPGGNSSGHFGLAVQDYSHSTAPNRRYPDLITQRLLKAAIAGRHMPYENGELSALAKLCTEKEDAAKKVERQVRKSAAAMLLEHRIGEQFDAFVTGAAEKGTWVRLLHPPVEGRLTSGFEGLDVGKRLRVQLIHTDVERGYIDFRRVGEAKG